MITERSSLTSPAIIVRKGIYLHAGEIIEPTEHKQTILIVCDS